MSYTPSLRVTSFKKGVVFLILGLFCSEIYAEIFNANTPLIRMRIGSNNNAINTVVYNAGIPAELGGLPGVTSEDEIISVNGIAGGSGVYRVRIVTDVNARPNTGAPLTGVFSYDSSNPMGCITAATCGGASIPMTKIRWNVRDGDTLNTVVNYNGSANQVFQTQIDTNISIRGRRARNYYQYVFVNDTLFPAGTYEGTVTLNGIGQ